MQRFAWRAIGTVLAALLLLPLAGCVQPAASDPGPATAPPSGEPWRFMIRVHNEGEKPLATWLNVTRSDKAETIRENWSAPAHDVRERVFHLNATDEIKVEVSWRVAGERRALGTGNPPGYGAGHSVTMRSPSCEVFVVDLRAHYERFPAQAPEGFALRDGLYGTGDMACAD